MIKKIKTFDVKTESELLFKNYFRFIGIYSKKGFAFFRNIVIILDKFRCIGRIKHRKE